jgi:hypothetical protein
VLRIRLASAALLLALAAGAGLALLPEATSSSHAFEVTAQTGLPTPQQPPTDDMYWDPIAP